MVGERETWETEVWGNEGPAGWLAGWFGWVDSGLRDPCLFGFLKKPF